MTEKNGVERSTATDVLRRMLDERGVEWQAPTSFDNTARYDTVAGGYWFHEFNGKMTIHGLTPAQAIAATLGPSNCSNNCTNGERTETCQADETDTWECVRDDLGGYGRPITVHVMECTKCGHTYEHVNGDYEFCPRCGRKREDVSE